MKHKLALQNLFMYLVREGFPLGVRDYGDVLKALGCGYGLHRREDLLRLCQTLWARTEEEKRVLDSLFHQFIHPTEDEVEKITGTQDPSSPASIKMPGYSSDTITPKKDKIVKHAKPQFGLQFVSSGDRKGIGLPSAKVLPRDDEYFILSPRLLISLRRLTVIWRRFRVAKREGPRTELDIEATIAEKCRYGILSEPVLVAARRNQARLVVLVDVSTSMTPWQGFNDVLVKSLQKGQFGEAKIYYFHNTPDDVLYDKETLTKPKTIAAALNGHQNSKLLIISDCGAARGYKSRERARDTERFLKSVSKSWYPVIWLNPMPSERWENTTAEVVKKLLNDRMFRLNEDGLIKAIDVLRGKYGN